MVHTEYTGMTKEQLKAEKDICEWRIFVAKGEIYRLERTIYFRRNLIQNKKDIIVSERQGALEAYLAGEIDEAEYKRRLKAFDKKWKVEKDYRRRFEECEAFIMEQRKNIRHIKTLIRIKGYDPREPISYTNKPGKHPGGTPKGVVPQCAAKKGEVRNPWGRKGKPKPPPEDENED